MGCISQKGWWQCNNSGGDGSDDGNCGGVSSDGGNYGDDEDNGDDAESDDHGQSVGLIGQKW